MTAIPVHPQPGFYETTLGEEYGDLWLTSTDFERIASRPPWSQIEAEQRLFSGRIEQVQGKHRQETQ